MTTPNAASAAATCPGNLVDADEFDLNFQIQLIDGQFVFPVPYKPAVDQCIAIKAGAETQIIPIQMIGGLPYPDICEEDETFSIEAVDDMNVLFSISDIPCGETYIIEDDVILNIEDDLKLYEVTLTSSIPEDQEVYIRNEGIYEIYEGPSFGKLFEDYTSRGY